jgi:hypothetical protein
MYGDVPNSWYRAATLEMTSNAAIPPISADSQDRILKCLLDVTPDLLRLTGQAYAVWVHQATPCLSHIMLAIELRLAAVARIPTSSGSLT